MTSESIQTTLDEGPLSVSRSGCERLGNILNWSPRLSIKLIVRKGNSIRAQLRFFHPDKKVIEWVKRALTTRNQIREHEGLWRINVTRRKTCQEIIKMLLPCLNATAKERALNLQEALDLLDATPRRLRTDTQSERLSELVELLR